jgi:hypothetical protein
MRVYEMCKYGIRNMIYNTEKKPFIYLAILLSLNIVLLSNNIGYTSGTFYNNETQTASAFQAWLSTKWTQTSQADFEAGVPNDVDTTSSPGDVKLVGPPTLIGSWTGETDFDTNGFNYTPGAGSNRVALVMITSESNSNPVANVNQVTLGGQVLTAIENPDGVVAGPAGSYHSLIWFGYLDEAGIGGMSGNALNITWDTAPTSDPTMVQAATYQNVDQTVPIADSASNINDWGSSIQAGNVSVGLKDRLVYVTVCGNPENHTAPGGYTEQLELDGPSWNQSNASVQRNATTAGTENPTATWSANNRLAIISAVLNALDDGTAYLSSQVLDTTIAGAAWDVLFWDETLESGTDITFEVRASDTIFLKDAGTPTWNAVGGSSPVTSGLSTGRYKQWRAILSTSDPTKTPTLHEVRVYYH